MINAFDHLFLIKNQLPTTLLKSISLLSDPKINLVILGCISIFLLIKKRFFAFEYKTLYLFTLTGFIMFICGIVKIVSGRARPFLLDEGIFGFFFFKVKHAYLSFPSSHSALAIAFTRAFKRWYKTPFIIFIYPIIIAFTRVLLLAHFASDVIAGLIFGYAVEKGIFILYQKSIKYLNLLNIKKLGDSKVP